MKGERKIAISLIGIALPYVCVVLVLVHYMQGHPGPLPRWIYLSMTFFFLFTLVIGSIIVMRVGRQAPFENSEAGEQRRTRSAKRLKAGMFVYVLILLNGIRLVAQDSLPWRYAIPGFAIDLLLIAMFWFSLRRLKKSESAAVSNHNPISSK